MTPANLSAMWSDVALAVGNHVWQSTLFAAGAGLLALTLRKNHARARYWVWLTASVKFLIPFSGLVQIGSRLAWTHASVETNAGVFVVMEQASRPFSPSLKVMPVILHAATPTALQGLFHLLPALLTAAWLVGFAGSSLCGACVGGGLPRPCGTQRRCAKGARSKRCSD